MTAGAEWDASLLRVGARQGNVCGLYYRDERERGQALALLVRWCQNAGGPLLFVGPPAVCDEARAALSRVAASDPLAPVDNIRWLSPQPSRDALDELVFAAHSHGENPAATWVELSSAHDLDLENEPQPGATRGLAPAIPWGHAAERVSAATRGGPVLFALPSGQVTGSVVRQILDAGGEVTSAPRLLARMGKSSELGAQSRQAMPEGGSDLDLGCILHHERMVTLGQLAAGIAHELGNPLAIIHSSLQILHKRLLEQRDPSCEFTAASLQNVERMHELLFAMLDVSKDQRPEFQEVELSAILADVLRFTAPECDVRRVAVSVSFDALMPRVRVDPRTIKQLILNVIKNALEAFGDHGGVLSVATRFEREPGTCVLDIQDDGPPIPPDVLEHLFQPFRTPKQGGTGLGLYLARRIAQDHQGDVQIENLPGDRGVRFSLHLPAHLAAEALG